MDLKQLTYFVTIIKEGNISSAAKRLNMSQPPLSTQIRLLEEELGCVLFERGARHVQLTEAGRLLYNRAETILEMSALTKQEILDYKNGVHGTLRFGVVSSVISTVLKEWITNFHTHYPDIQFHVVEGNTYELIQQLRSNLIELAIVRTPFSIQDLNCVFFPPEPMLAVGHKKYFVNVSSDFISITELAGKPLILYQRWESLVHTCFSDAHMTPNIFCMNDDARTTAYWADSGLGIGILPASGAGLLQNPDSICKKISDNRLNSSISIISNKNTYQSAIAKIFTEYVKEKNNSD